MLDLNKPSRWRGEAPVTFEESVQAYRAGWISRPELRLPALAGLTLRNVHVRMGVSEVRESMGDPSASHRVRHGSGPRTSPWRRAALVLRTWSRPPAGGWLRAQTAWQRLLQLESMVDGADVHGLEEDRADPEPAIRAWAVVVRDVQGDISGLRLDLEDPDPDVRLLAAAALVERGRADERVRSVLRDLLDVASCSEEAVAVLGPLRDPSAAPKLLELYVAAHRRDVLGALAFVEALPILERELIENNSRDALRAVELLGQEAGPLWQPILAKLSAYADLPVAEEGVTGRKLMIGPYHAASELVDALIALGDAASAAGPVLLGWAGRRAQVGDFCTFECAAAGAVGAVSHEARAELGRWLDGSNPVLQHRALHGLAAGGRASWPWRDAVAHKLRDAELAVDASVALASMGDTRAARDAWLRFEASPPMHPRFHRLEDLLIRDLPDCVDPNDTEEVALAVKVLQGAGRRDRNAGSCVLFIPADGEDTVGFAAGKALERLERRIEAGRSNASRSPESR